MVSGIRCGSAKLVLRKAEVGKRKGLDVTRGIDRKSFERKDGRPVVHLGGCSTVKDCFSGKNFSADWF